MDSLFFIILFFSIPAIAFIMLRISGIKLQNISIPSVFVIFYLIAAYCGIFPMYFGLYQYWVNLGAVDREIVFLLLIFSGVTLLLICLGFLIASRLIGFRPLPFSPVRRGIGKIGMCFIFTLVFICFLVTLLYISQLSDVPILAAIKGNVKEVAFLRSEATNAFAGKHHRYAMFMHNLLPFLTMVLFSNAVFKSKRISWIAFSAVFFFALFDSVISAKKGPPLFLLCGLFFVYHLTRGKPFRLRSVIYGTIILFIPSYFMWVYIMGVHDRSILEIITAISRRIISAVVPAYFYLEMFPDSVDFLYGRTLPNPGGVIQGYEPYRLTVEVANFMKPELLDKDIVSSAPTAFWAELYANFGNSGVFLFTPVIGVILQIGQALISRLQSSPVKIALTVWLAFHLMKLGYTSFSKYLIDLNMYLIIIVSLSLLFLDGNGRIVLTRRKSPSQIDERHGVLKSNAS